MRPSLVARLVIASALTIVVVAATVLWTRSELQDASRTARRLAERSVLGIEFAARLQRVLHDRSYVSTYLLTGDPRFLHAGGEAPDPAALGAWIEQMDMFAETPAERALLEQMRLRYLAYTAHGDEAVQRGLQGDPDGAQRSFLSMKNELDAFLDDSQSLFSSARADMEERQQFAAAKLQRGHQVLLTLSCLGALGSLALAVLLARRAVRPLSQLVLRLSSAGGGVLTVSGDALTTLESEVNRLLERVRQQERALLQAEKLSELGIIAAEVAHETLNPLAGAMGIVQVVRRTPSLTHETIAGELAGVERELGRVEQTVVRLVKYARPLEPHVRSVELRTLVEDTLERTRRSPAGQGRTFELSEVPDQRWMLDPDLLAQVLVNLLVNACEASPPDTPVALRVSTSETELCIEVSDRGSGILEAQRERLFRPFFTTKPTGNGLGLAVSRNIVIEHGGRIEATPREGGGTVFRVVLPREVTAWQRAS